VNNKANKQVPVVLSADANLNRELVAQLKAMCETGHAQSECWSSASVVVTEALLWIALGAVLWMITLFVIA
jgi:hypothetical protein